MTVAASPLDWTQVSVVRRCFDGLIALGVWTDLPAPVFNTEPCDLKASRGEFVLEAAVCLF